MSEMKVLDAGTVIGRRYVILAAVGGDGNGLHYRAQEIDSQAIWAITEYAPEGLALRTADGAVAPANEAAATLFEEGLKSFLSRAQALSELAHSGLPASEPPISERGTAYAVSKHLDGAKLIEWADNLGRPPSQGELDVLIAPVLDALATLHRAGLLHLAITPEAIVVKDGCDAILAGLWAGLLAPGTKPHPTGATADHAAPELLAGKSAEIGPRTDIYGLAASLYTLLSGTPPARAAAVQGETWFPPAVPARGAGYRPEFLQAVATSLAPMPSGRPPSASALKSLLFDDAFPEPSIARAEVPKPPSPAADPSPGARINRVTVFPRSMQFPRTPVPWFVILLLGGGILVGLGYLGLHPRLPPPKPDVTAEPRPPSVDASPPTFAPSGPQGAAHPDNGRGAQRALEAAQAMRQRIAQATDRTELLRVAEAAPAHRAEVESRLLELGFLRLVKRDGVAWLRPAPDESFSECEGCPQMVALPAATFQMGSLSTEPGRQDDEDDTPGPGGNPIPARIARPFAIAKHEITRSQFAAFVNATGYQVEPGCYAREIRRELRQDLSWIGPGFEQDDQHPVTCVSWRDARAYARWLSATTGATYRLPTEAEWEYAARGQSTAPYSFGNESSDICKYGNGADRTAREANADWIVAACRDGFRFTAPVGSFMPNRFGLHDMHGNVWEWVEDCESDSLAHVVSSLTGSSVAGTACAPQTPRILRGGAWSDPPQRLRSAARISGPPNVRDYIVGFRVVRNLD